MKKHLFFVLISLFLAGCKSKQFVDSTEAIKPMNSKVLLKKLQENKLDFKTLYIKSSARYQDANQTQNVTADIRIKKDETILISIRFLGITMAKALITPDKVQYYEKIEHTHFEGDFIGLSNWLGTPLDFQKIQNLLIGKPLYNLEELKLAYEIQNNMHVLGTNDGKLDKYFYFNNDFQLVQQFFKSIANQTELSMLHADFQSEQNQLLPTKLTIVATQVAQAVQIAMVYNNITVNEDFSFPYDVPKGSTQIYID
jgi:hypothetical protein